VLNGDTFLELDYAAMRRAHQRAQERLSLAACRVADTARYGALDVEAGHVRGFHEKGRSGPGLINAGTYLLSPEVWRRIPAGEPFSFEQQLLMPGVDTLRPAAFETDGLFIDIGVPDDYALAQRLFAARAAAT
jgi:D-glycero-alpha-D-manno-heptose 1-phosphate guanylyltransferase